MQSTTVLLAFGPRLFYESLASELEPLKDTLPLISEASELPELLVEVQQTQADTVIISSVSQAAAAGIRSHLFAEFPHLSLIVLSTEDETAVVFRQEVVAKQIRSVSLETILTALREGERYWSPL